MPDPQETPAFQIPQRVLLLRDLCIREHGGACERCASACPAQAISLPTAGAPAIDSDACTMCCACVGVCDAFTTPRTTLTDMRSRILRIALAGQTPIVTCEETLAAQGREPAANVVALPCLAAMPAELWALALVESTEGIDVALDFAACEQCSRAGATGGDLAAAAIAQAEGWTGRTAGFTEEIPEKETLLGGLLDEGGLDRRGALSGALSQLADIASGRYRARTHAPLEHGREHRERERLRARLKLDDGLQFNRFARHGRLRKTITPSRLLLLQAIDRDPSIASRVELRAPSIDPDRCQGELSCSAACPTGALAPDPDTGAISFDGRYCTGCDLCEPACPHAAVSLMKTTAEAVMVR